MIFFSFSLSISLSLSLCVCVCLVCFVRVFVPLFSTNLTRVDGDQVNEGSSVVILVELNNSI